MKSDKLSFESDGFTVIELKNFDVLSEFTGELHRALSYLDYSSSRFIDLVFEFQQKFNLSHFHHKISVPILPALTDLAEGDDLLISGVAFLRVVRPQKAASRYEFLDFHRESFYATGDFVHSQINIHVPISGYCADSAMRYVPKSHIIPDQEFSLEPISTAITGVERGSVKHRTGMVYSPKRIVAGCDLSAATPFDVKPGQAVIFKSDLVHGGGANFSQDIRISVDFAIIRASRISDEHNHQLASYSEDQKKYVEISKS